MARQLGAAVAVLPHVVLEQAVAVPPNYSIDMRWDVPMFPLAYVLYRQKQSRPLPRSTSS